MSSSRQECGQRGRGPVGSASMDCMAFRAKESP